MAAPAPELDLADCTFTGPALSPSFLGAELPRLPAARGLRDTVPGWHALAGGLGRLRGEAGPLRVAAEVLRPLAAVLGYAAPRPASPVQTREGLEEGGWALPAPDGPGLRAWCLGAGANLVAPRRGGRAYRFSPVRRAQRVLLAQGEPLGLLTDGGELRLLLCDPARQNSQLSIDLAGWCASEPPDSFRLVRALAAPSGLRALPAILEAARLSQARLTAELRVQARAALEGFIQAVLDHPDNAAVPAPAGALWEEGLTLVHRLLFILKLEGAEGGAFSFAAGRLWREAFSPGRALAPLARRCLDHGEDTGRMLEDGLRLLFRLCRDGLACSEMRIPALGGALFDAGSTPLLDRLAWGEIAVARLLDRLLWTSPRAGGARERVQYGALDVEDLGHIYEALLELEPGIAMPADRADRAGANPVGRFVLRTGLGRKTTGAYYTPHAFVRFLVRETLAPLVAARSPADDPAPAAILALKVVDPAVGSGHFLVEACRYLGDALHAACVGCDARAAAAEAEAVRVPPDRRAASLRRAAAWRARLAALPDPDRTLPAYLPSRVAQGDGAADWQSISEGRARAICRRLVAVNCLYGVDRNRLAVELAKLSLWLETYAEGLPLTFLDHRLVHGDSLSGPFFPLLATLPVGGTPLDPLLAGEVAAGMEAARRRALADVRALEASVGHDAADLLAKETAKARLDATLDPWRALARAWAGAAALALREADDEYIALARIVAAHEGVPCDLTARQAALLEAGAAALPWDLMFPEAFVPGRGGFDAVLGNPPWDILQQNGSEFFAAHDLSPPGTAAPGAARHRRESLRADPVMADALRRYQEGFIQQHRLIARLYQHQYGGSAGRLDAFRVFAERNLQLAGTAGAVGIVVPSAFHTNQGAAGIRRGYLDGTAIEWYLSFENRRRLFDIHASFRFALLVARRPGPTRSLRCGFYLDDPAALDGPGRLLRYDRAFIAATGGAARTFLEVRSGEDLALARRVFLGRASFGDWCGAQGVTIGREMNVTDDAHRLVPASAARPGWPRLHEGKTLHQFTDRWSVPRHAIDPAAIADKPAWVGAARFYRLALRKIARSTDERTAIAAIITPGYLCNDTALVERTPGTRANAAALLLCGVINSFTFDWVLRQKLAATVNLFILESCPLAVPEGIGARLVAHGALALSCRHAGYAALWRDQLGAPPPHWPALTNPEMERLRAAMDAVIAHAWALKRDEYRRVLDSFRHRSWPEAPAWCLAAFDDLYARGLEAFCHAHDPWAEVPLPGVRDSGPALPPTLSRKGRGSRARSAAFPPALGGEGGGTEEQRAATAIEAIPIASA